MKKLLYLAILLLAACRNHIDEPQPCELPASGEVLYSRHVSLILGSSCTFSSCHTTGFDYGDFTRFEEIKEKAESGKLEFMIVSKQMPHGHTQGSHYLTDCEITTIKTWIRNGAKNN